MPENVGTGRSEEFRGARAAHNSAVVAISQLATMFIAFFTTPIALHQLGKIEFGIWTVAIAFIGYITVVDPGFNDIVTRYGAIARARGETRIAARICALGSLVWLVIGLIMLPIVLIVVPFFVDHLHLNPGLASVTDQFFYWSFGLVIFSSVLSTTSGRLAAIGDQWLVSTIDVSTRAIWAVLFIAMLEAGMKLSAVLVATSVQYFLAFAATLIAIAVRDGRPYASPFGLDAEIRREVFRFGGWLQLSSLLEYLTYETDPLILGVAVNVNAVSNWGLAQRLGRQIPSFASIPSNNVLPALAASYGAKEGLETFRRIYVRANSIVVLIGAMLTGVVIAFAPLIMKAWLGLSNPDIWATSTATVLVALTFASGVPRQVTAKAIMAMGRVGYGARAQYLAFVINVVLTLSLVWSFGLNGVLGATLVAKIAATGYLLIRFVKLVDSTMKELVWSWLAPIIAVTAVCSIVGRIVTDNWTWALHDRMAATVGLAVLGSLYTLLFGIGLRITRFFTIDDLRWIRSIAPGPFGRLISPRLVRLLTGIHA